MAVFSRLVLAEVASAGTTRLCKMGASQKENNMDGLKVFNRELSWIEFNKRVLHLALDKSLPLMERLQFLAIVTSNFDEFFRVRVASAKRAQKIAPDKVDASGNTPQSLLLAISQRVHETLATQYDCLVNDILPALADKRIVFTKGADFDDVQTEYARRTFQTQILPLLTPLRCEELFPNVKGNVVYVAFLLEPIQKAADNSNGQKIALVAVPHGLPHVINIPATDTKKHAVYFTLIEELIALFGTQLFSGYSVCETLIFKITRDADFAVEEEGGGDFIHEMEKVLIQRKSSFAVSLVTNGNSETLQNYISTSLELLDEDIYKVPLVVDIPSLMELRGVEEAGGLSFPEWKHFMPKELPQNMPYWDTIKGHDILLNVPYMSYEPVVKFLEDAASDPQVLSIKMTLYRTGSNSPIIDALEKASRAGKQVTVLVELKARFDEERNITWAGRLENAGATVIYGLVNLKVHAKIALVIRQEGDAIMRYVHLATGNYNVKTATLYSDLSIFTANSQIAQDATKFFNLITGYSTLQDMSTLFMAPVTLKSQLISMIDREIERHKFYHNGLIKAKMNSLTDLEVIAALYKASNAGVKIMLNIRGICMLIPGTKEFSKNITVTSIVDRYLEHSRIFFFQNGTAPEIYLASADWMERNLDRRIELMFPILDKAIFHEVIDILDTYFKDTTNSHTLLSSGEWASNATENKPFRAQESLYQKQRKACEATAVTKKSRFISRRNKA